MSAEKWKKNRVDVNEIFLSLQFQVDWKDDSLDAVCTRFSIQVRWK